MCQSEMVDMAIVGDGCTSIFVARGHAHEMMMRGWCETERKIRIIGPHERVGPGTAWDESHPLMSSNMQERTLGIFGGVNERGDGFEIDKLVDLFPGDREARGLQPYVQRGAVGNVLNLLYHETRLVARGHNISIGHLRSEVTQIVREPDGFRLGMADGRTVQARSVVLAVGLLSIDRYPHLAGYPSYLADSWRSADFLESVSDDQRVAIAGLGPTGIDWLLRLADRDFVQPILMASRSGLLPAARPLTLRRAPEGLFSARRIRRMATKGALSRREIDIIINAILDRFGVTPTHLATHQALLQGHPQDLIEQTLANSRESQPLFEALKEIDDLASVIWRCADEAAQAHIMRKWAKHYARLSFAVPPSNARALLDQLGTHRLRIRRGLEDVISRDGRLQLHFDANGDGEARVETVDVLINASGFDGRLADVNNHLVRSLMASGLLVEATYGGACMDYETGQVLDANGRKVEGLYIAGGSLTRSAGFVVNSLVRTSEHGIGVGRSSARYLQVLASINHKRRTDQPLIQDFVI